MDIFGWIGLATWLQCWGYALWFVPGHKIYCSGAWSWFTWINHDFWVLECWQKYIELMGVDVLAEKILKISTSDWWKYIPRKGAQKRWSIATHMVVSLRFVTPIVSRVCHLNSWRSRDQGPPTPQNAWTAINLSKSWGDYLGKKYVPSGFCWPSFRV